MKDSESSGNRRKIKKGYAVAMALCLVAMGAAGYGILTTVGETPTPESVSISVAPKPAAPAKPASAPVEEKPADETVREIAAQVTVSPVKGEVIRTFSVDSLSYNETTKDWRLHPAVDIAAQGQSVMAAMAGTVTEVFDDDYLGTTVVLRHDGGYETRYSNLTAMPTVKVGDTVKAGDVIGAVGDTAILESAEPPHLHFQVMQDGEPVDPAAIVE